MYLFGSVARRAPNPSDIDVYLDWNVDPENERSVADYTKLQPQLVSSIPEECRRRFGVPLSIHNGYVGAAPDDAWPAIQSAGRQPVLRRGCVIVAATKSHTARQIPLDLRRMA